MIYSAWYFCNIAKLSIVETKGVLSTVQALSCRETGFEEKSNVVDRLGEYDTLIQSYMIPYLTACLLASDDRKWLNGLPDTLVRQEYIQKIKDLLSDCMPEPKSLAITNLIHNLENITHDNVVKSVMIYSGNTNTLLEEDFGYLQGDRYFREIFQLSVLRCVAFENASMVSDFVRGDKQIELVQSALMGYYGQLCWNIATEIMLLCGITAHEVIRTLPENWQERPDMVELVVPFLFPDTTEDSVQKIMEETYELIQFKKYWRKQKEQQNGCWMNPNATKEERTRLCIILWQNVLWNLAMNRDFDCCVKLLKDMWETPDFSSGKISSRLCLDQCQRYMLPKNINIYNEEWVRRYMCSPWQERTESVWNKGRWQKGAAKDTEGFFHEFRGIVSNDSSMKVFMSCYLMKRIFIIQGQEIEDSFIRLLFHFGDLFSCYGVRNTFQQITSPPIDGIRVAAWTLPIRALGYLASDIIKRIGMGLINPFVPAKIVNHLYRRSPLLGKQEAYKNGQLKYLYDFCAFLTAAYWAYESLSTTSITNNGLANMWIKNGDRSSAAKLCKWIFSKLYRLAANDRSALQLNVQAFDSEYTLNRRNGLSEGLLKTVSNKSARVRFNQLILSRKLTYSEWYEIGDISRQKFEKDAYLIAHTMRIQSLLESEYSALGHDWINDWKNAVSDISYKWEFSRMARYIMVQMFSINPGHKDNYVVLVDLLKMIIYMIQEFASLDSIYYIYRLSEGLIGLSGELGVETREELRGINAVELYSNMENCIEFSGYINKWEELFFYYLLRISEDGRIDSERYAGKQLGRYWRDKEVRRNHLRTELIEAAEWNQLTDRMWMIKKGKLLVVRDALAIPEECNIGIVTEVYRCKDGTFNYEIYSQGQRKKFERVPNKKLYKGDVVEIKGGDQTKIENFEDICWKPSKGEKVRASFEITGDEISVTVMGKEYTKKYGDSPELFRMWNGDLEELFSKGHHIKGYTVVQYAEFKAGICSWIPFANGYAEFLVQKMFLPDNPQRKCALTFLGEMNNDTGLLFSVKAGENYKFEAENWTQDSWKKIKKDLIESDDRRGMIVRIQLIEVDGLPRLELDTDEPYDYRNIRWREQFTDEQPIQIWHADNKWVTETDVQDIRKRINVYVKSKKGQLDTSRKHYVQVINGGWEEYNQRKGYLEVEEVKSKVLDYRAISYDQLKQLIQIKEGDVFKLGRKQPKQQKRGYYSIELDNRFPVYCAAESVSFLPDSNDMRFWQNRLCVVDHVKKYRNYDEDECKAKPCNPVELQEKQGRYMGILAEFTPIINKGAEYVKDLTLKVILDIDGGKEVINVPVSAFILKPLHLGDRIEAVYGDGGWIFTMLRRTINVRALWQIEDHRGQDREQIFGAPLGVANISRIGNCMVTQDEEKPVLHLWNPEADFQRAFTMQCGIKIGKGKVEELVRRYSNHKIFRWAYQTAIVALQSGGDVFIGEARLGAFTVMSGGWRVKAEIYRIYETQSEIFYDLRRCFIPINSGLSRNDLTREIQEERTTYYLEWLETENGYATGQISSHLYNADKIELKELYVPGIITEQLAEAEWVNEIPLEEKQRSIVSRDYSREDIRVRLKNRNGRYIASINDVEAMPLDDKLIAYFGAADGYIEKRDFYFAGRDDQGRLLFEWGYGYIFAADIQDVTDMNGNTIGNELFFGDHIKSFQFHFDLSGKCHWKVRVLMEWISHRVEGQVWQDAENGIIQLLRVRINQTDGKVEIYEVSVSGRSVKTSGKQSNGWEFLPIGSARLKSKGMETLASQMKTAQKEMVVFAQLDMQNYDKASEWREFTYIPLNGNRDQLEVLNNKIVCLTAGRIKHADMRHMTSKVVNDQKLDFFLPDELPDECEKPHLIVSVMRRNFSLDESRLRVYSRINPDAYYGDKMLVKLKEISTERNTEKNTERFAAWSGSVLETLFRSNDSLINYLMIKKECIVTLGTLERNEQKLKCAEISPGIIFNITKFCTQIQWVNGSFASLRLENDKLVPEVVLPGDIQYIPDNGRPVELLIMDGVLKKYDQTVDMDEETARKAKMSLGGHFTIAGFPQIRIQNPELLDRMIRSEFPRLGIIYKRFEQKLELKAADENVRAGYLEVSRESGMPVLNLISPVSRTVYTSWDQITFMDGKPEEIIEYVQHGVWHYHDEFTGVYTDEDKKIHSKPLPDGQYYKEILVFAGEKNRLRYHPKEFEKFGMSAREIIENGLSKHSKWYSIAGVTDHSLWIEIFPGKVLELLRTYLATGILKSSLSQLYVGAFAPGDRILLDEEKTVVGGHGKILLLGYKFGVRSVIGRGRAFLPVQESKEDCLCLGGGFWKMNYPKGSNMGVNDGSRIVMLDLDNKLSDAKMSEQVMKGDCVFLTLDERDRLCIAGGAHIKVEFAKESSWGEMVWLLRALQQDLRGVLRVFENYLPVTVIGKNADSTKVVVVYKRQDYPCIDENMTLCCNCIGMIRYMDKKRIILRSGGYLFYIDEEEFMMGVSKRIMEIIVSTLSAKRTEFLVSKVEGKWKVGLDLQDDPEKMEIQILYAIPKAKGFLCRNRKSLSLGWLPQEYSCRVQNVETEKIWMVLSENRNRMAKLMENGTLSLIHEQECYRRFKLLDPRSTKYRVIPKAEVRKEEDYYYYLCELYPSGELLMLKSENCQDCGQENPIRVAFLEKQEMSITVVPFGQMRQKIYLSSWIMRAYRNAYCYEENDGYLDCEVFRQYIPERFDNYLKMIKRAKEDADSGIYKNDGFRLPDGLEDRLVYLYELLQVSDTKQSDDKAWIYLKIYDALKSWLSYQGKILARGFFKTGKYSENVTLDLLPTITAILLLNRIKFTNKQPGKGLVLHLMCMLGYASGNSVHQEALLKLWLLNRNQGGVWKRLNRLSLGGESMQDKFQGIESEPSKIFDGTLREEQYDTLIEIAEGIAGRHVEDNNAKVVAESLLYSVGVERDYTELYQSLNKQDFCCSILAILGKILILQKDKCQNDDRLVGKHIKTLERVLTNLCHEMQPIELLTAIPIPLSEEQRIDATEKCDLVINLLIQKSRDEKNRS